MIEQFSTEELAQIVIELKQRGYKIDQSGKMETIREAAKEIDLEKFQMAYGLESAFVSVIDFTLGNVEEKVPKNGGISRTCRRKYVPDEMVGDYKELAKALLVALKPYIGKGDFSIMSEELFETAKRRQLSMRNL